MKIHQLPLPLVEMTRGIMMGQKATLMRWLKIKGRIYCNVQFDDGSDWDFPRSIMRIVTDDDEKRTVRGKAE